MKNYIFLLLIGFLLVSCQSDEESTFGSEHMQLSEAEFQTLVDERYSAVIKRLEQIREVELAFKARRIDLNEFVFPCNRLNNAKYSDDFDELIHFVQFDSLWVLERRDTSFIAFDEVSRTDMLKEECVSKVVGKISVLAYLEQNYPSLFSVDFNPTVLKFIPFTDNKVFNLDTVSVNIRGEKINLFEVSVPNDVIFADILKTNRNEIENLPIKELKLGSLVEPTLNGNWKY